MVGSQTSPRARSDWAVTTCSASGMKNRHDSINAGAAMAMVAASRV